jgi:glucosylceramidase
MDRLDLCRRGGTMRIEMRRPVLALSASCLTLAVCAAGASGRQTGARALSPAIAVHVVQTTADLSQRLTRLRDLWMEPGPVPASRIIRIRDRVRYQTILGFGATVTASSAWLIHDELPPAARDAVMRKLFSSSGIDLNFIRVPIGASDYTVRALPYSYDDMIPGESDARLSHFSVAHDLPYIIPTLRQALAIHPGIFVMGSPWSAPGWMKANERLNNFHGLGTLSPADYGAYAEYFVKFVRAYRRHGIRVDAVTPQNEPGVPTDPEMSFFEPEEATFVAHYLRRSLAAAGLGTQIYGVDTSWGASPYADALAFGPAGGALDGIAWHCYSGSPTVMARLHARVPRLVELVDECSPEIRPFHTAEALIGSLRNWANGVALWNLALNPAGGPVQQLGSWCPSCQGLTSIDEATHKADLGSRYYQLGQVSKFVMRGAVHVAANTFVRDGTSAVHFYQPTVGLDDVAFVDPDGKKVLVTFNNARDPAPFAVSWRRHAFLYSEPPGAMTTFTWR